MPFLLRVAVVGTADRAARLVDTGTKACIAFWLRIVQGATTSTVTTVRTATGASARQERRGAGPHSASATGRTTTTPFVRARRVSPSRTPTASDQRTRWRDWIATTVAATTASTRVRNSVSVSSVPPATMSGTQVAPTASASSPGAGPTAVSRMKPISATESVPSSARKLRPASQRSAVSGSLTAKTRGQRRRPPRRAEGGAADVRVGLAAVLLRGLGAVRRVAAALHDRAGQAVVVTVVVDRDVEFGVAAMNAKRVASASASRSQTTRPLTPPAGTDAEPAMRRTSVSVTRAPSATQAQSTRSGVSVGLWYSAAACTR